MAMAFTPKRKANYIVKLVSSLSLDCTEMAKELLDDETGPEWTQGS